MLISKQLLEIMACPKCKSDIKEENLFLTCQKCSLAYPILEDVPDMLIEDAWPLEKAKKSNFTHNLKL